MSLAMLLEKYDVSTEDGLQKALGDIEKEELEVDEALCNALSRVTSLEGRLRTASQAYNKLGEVKADAQSAANMVEKTAALAQDVSAKVRQLDLARSRVAECQRRVHDLIDLQLCSAGVEAALKAHDYETAAGHVSRFLSMDPGSVAAAKAQGAPDPRNAMDAAATALRDHLVKKFEEAARKEDEASVERLFKLFPQIGRTDEGVELLAKYLATQLERQLRTGAATSWSSPSALAEAVSSAVRTAAAAVRRLAALTQHLGRLHKALVYIQPKVSSAIRVIYQQAVSARALNSVLSGRPTALAVEPLLAELVHAHATILSYCAALVHTAQVDASKLDEENRKQCVEAVERLIADSEMTRTAQDLLGHYLELERYFLEESVNKAVRMNTSQVGATTSNLVDDVFFIAKKVLRRAVSSGSVDGVCAVINETGSLLERSVCSALRKALRSVPSEPLPLPPPRPTQPLALDLLDLARRDHDLDQQRALYLCVIRECELGAEWSSRLAEEAVTLCGSRGGAAERARLTQCAAGLGAASAAFRALWEHALTQVQSALKHNVYAWADAIAAPMRYEDDLEESTADALPGALETLLTSAKDSLAEKAAEALVTGVLLDLATRIEATVLQQTYDQSRGCCVERSCRRVCVWAGGAGLGGARERLARLAQAAALLALQHPQQAQDVLQPPRITPHKAREILRRRTDFKVDDIKRLKL